MEKKDSRDIEAKMDELVSEAQKSNDTSELEELAENLYETAYNFYTLKFYDEAMLYFRRFLDFKRQISPMVDHKIANAKNSIGEIYFQQDNYDEALIHYNESVLNYKQTMVNENVDFTHFRIGVCLERQEKYADALKAYSESAEVKEDLLDLKGQDIHTILSKLGTIYKKPVTYCETI